MRGVTRVLGIKKALAIMLSNHRCSPEWSTTVLLALAKLLKLILDSKLFGRNFQFSGKKSEGRELISALPP